MTDFQWPEKPSDLILLALRDFEQIEHDPKYTIDMSMWHLVDHTSNKCCVCFAGSVMATDFGVAPDMDVEGEAFGQPHYDNFLALNEFRKGSLFGGYTILMRKLPEDLPTWMEFPLYNEDRKGWWNSMLDLVGMLQACGE